MKHRLILGILIISVWTAGIARAADEDIIKVFPKDYEEATMGEAKVCAENGMYQEAIAKLDKVTDFNPNNAMAYNIRGFIYVMLDEYDKALEDFAQAINKDPSYADSYYNRGIIYARNKNKFDSAIIDFTRAIRLKSDFAEAYLGRGTALAKKGQYGSAIADYSAAITINPADGELYYNRAVSYYAVGECTKAFQDVIEARQLGCAVDPAFIRKLEIATGRQA